MAEVSASATAGQIARQSYGRLLAILARRTRDIATAEDALAEALANGLRVWPKSGVPDNPEAWLLTAARRTMGKAARHHGVRDANAMDLAMVMDEMAEPKTAEIPDARLELLFVCAHPAIAADVRAPLMLQTVLGLDAARIARAYLVAPASMGQRLVRAKSKIRDAGIGFTVPYGPELADRVDDVLSAIYAAYTLGWDDISGLCNAAEPLTGEAIFLARLVASLLPDAAEAKGLLALMLYCEARHATRRDDGGRYLPLSQQDARQWDAAMTSEAEAQLRAAAALGQFGRFQTEAAIQSLHAQAAMTGDMPVAPLLQLYDVLVRQWPSTGAQVAHAVAVGRWRDPVAGLVLLDQIEPAKVRNYQPYWVARAHLLQSAGQNASARAARAQAMLLTTDPVVLQFLQRQ